MSCGISCIKYMLFIFNFIFTLLGLLILGLGIWSNIELGNLSSLDDFIGTPTILFIVLGAIIFVIAFFGCCGAIRESHCMVVTFAVLLLTVLIIQIAIGVWVFLLGRNVDTQELETSYRTTFNNYWTSEPDRIVINNVQQTLECCGVTSYTDFTALGNNTIPWSCCGNPTDTPCSSTNAYQKGCVTLMSEFFQSSAKVLGGVAIGVAAVELIGIIFALCLANSIRNDDRRGYRV